MFRAKSLERVDSYHSGTLPHWQQSCQGLCCQIGHGLGGLVMATMYGMATSRRPKMYPQPGRQAGDFDQPLYLTEWMLKKGVGDAEMGRRLGEDRSTVYKWRTQQQRLDPLTMARVAAVLGIWPPQLWVRPGSQQDRVIQAAAPEPGPWTPPDELEKIPTPPRRK
jgi:hypothetical protein